MRYLLARRFNHGSPSRADTVLYVIQPEVLFGTYVRISEDAVQGSCEVHTYLPTMARPLQVAEALTFDCLPLTDVGYTDLMAWPHPALRPVAEGEDPDAPESDTDIADPATSVIVHYHGPPSLPTLRVREVIDVELGIVRRRIFYRDGQRIRSWEITETGESGEPTLPRRIQVARPQTGHETNFVRTTPAVDVPPEIFDGEPELLRKRIEELLTRR